MYQKKVTVNLPEGLGGLESTVFVTEASKYKSVINIAKDSKSMDAKNVLGVMALNIEPSDRVIISAEGYDCEEAVNKLSDILQQKQLQM